MAGSFIFAGALVGGVLGFLARPSAFMVGQLPFSTVITRGASLEGLESVLYPLAVESFNYLMFGLLGGGVIGGIVGSQIGNNNQKQSKKEEIENTTGLVSEADSVPASEYPAVDERKRTINRSLVGLPKEFIIACFYCGQKIRGDSKTCPLCDTPVPENNRKITPNYSAKVSSHQNEKKCQYCAEVIKVEAIKCKHCGSMLPVSSDDIAIIEESNKLGDITENILPSSDSPSVDNFCTNCGARRERNDQQFCTKCGKNFRLQ